MKKFLLFVFGLFVLTGCGNQQVQLEKSIQKLADTDYFDYTFEMKKKTLKPNEKENMVLSLSSRMDQKFKTAYYEIKKNDWTIQKYIDQGNNNIYLKEGDERRFYKRKNVSNEYEQLLSWYQLLKNMTYEQTISCDAPNQMCFSIRLQEENVVSFLKKHGFDTISFGDFASASRAFVVLDKKTKNMLQFQVDFANALSEDSVLFQFHELSFTYRFTYSTYARSVIIPIEIITGYADSYPDVEVK